MISLIGFIFLCSSIFSSLLLVIWNSYKYDTLNLYKFNLITRTSTIFALLSFFSLMFAYVTSDFSNYNVFQNSHSSKPLIYKIAGTWGNHEGSMLMWVSIMSLYNFLLSLNKKLDEKFMRSTIVVQTILFLIFTFFVIFASNPFLVNSIDVNEGLGLNPILQDPALALHPPLLYLGYIGYSLIFSFSIVGLLQKNINSNWINVVKKWSLFCWSMLTGGIALGSYWAYYELGWGGWWFWDPVENLSLMPWITGLALVHSLFITKEEQSLKKWIVFLSILCFSLSVFGTFLVRSGILVSVHTFASDPARGLFILLIFFLITGFGFIIFLIKTPKENNSLQLLFINKTSALIINNMVMIIACLTIFLGTIYPIIIEVITDTRISVGGPYFTSTVIPIMLPALLLMSIAPILSWQSNRIKKAKYYTVVFLLISFLLLIFSFITSFNPWAFIGTLFGIWIIVASLMSIYFFYNVSFNLKYIKNINTYIAHSGVGIIIIGITFSSIFKQEENYLLSIGEQEKISNVSVILNEIKYIDKDNFTKLRGLFSIKKNGREIKLIEAGKNYYFVSKIITTEAGIFHDWFRDIYIVLGDQKDNKWSVKIYNNPLVSFIWLGIIVIIFSGLIGIIKK